jgi:cbb3-type cytochrome oxidase maturation protein
MEILYLLIPLSLVLVGVIIWAFFWAVRSGQFDDLEGPAYRILMDDDGPPGRKSGGEESEKLEVKGKKSPTPAAGIRNNR